MKKIIFVNSNMKIGGIQKALVNLLKTISSEYEVTLFLFHEKGEYLLDIPSNVKVLRCKSWFKYLGMGQDEMKKNPLGFFFRGFLAFLTRIFGRSFTLKLMGISQRILKQEYDYAISYMQNGHQKSFYGGCNEFVLKKIKAKQKIAFLHCDYEISGANNQLNNKLYYQFDKIAFCSEGCQRSFEKILPELSEKCFTVHNCHDFNKILSLAEQNTVYYPEGVFNIVSVARLNQEKGIDRAILAINELTCNEQQVHYHIVGDGILKTDLQNLVKDLKLQDTVTFYGNQTNPYPYIKQADLLFIPSRHEAAPMVIDEAICLGCPIFSTETTSVQEMILDRKVGFVCKNNQEAINEGLQQVLAEKGQVEQLKNYIREKIYLNNGNAVNLFMQLLGENE